MGDFWAGVAVAIPVGAVAGAVAALLVLRWGIARYERESRNDRA